VRAEQTGIVVARGIGLGLIVFGACTGIGGFTFFVPSTTSGWTSYSPSVTTATTTTSTILGISYIALANLLLPSMGEIVAGSALILFSKPVGRWLARGLNDDEKE
jgi:hypothetical protein